MTRSRRVPAVICGVLLALGWAGAASAGPAPIRWDSGAVPTVVQPELLAGGQVVFGAVPVLLATERLGGVEFALVLQTPQLSHGELRGRGHLFLMRRRVDDSDPLRPWERVGGQIDDMDPAEDGKTEDTGVQTARLACFVGDCEVAYVSQGRVTLARLVEIGHGYGWERARLDARTADRVGQLAVIGGYVAWTQADPGSRTESTVRLARVSWPDGGDLEVRKVVSLGRGGQLELAGSALMVSDDREIRVYYASDALEHGRVNPVRTLVREQPSGRVLLSRYGHFPQYGYLVVEPVPGGVLAHDLVFGSDGRQQITMLEHASYRFDNPAWLPVGAAPMAFTPNADHDDDPGWLLVGAPGAPGRHALVRITAEFDDTLGARFYQIPGLPAPAGYDPGATRVTPRIIGLLNATIAGGLPTVDLLTSAEVIRLNDTPIAGEPIGQLMLLGERLTLDRASQ